MNKLQGKVALVTGGNSGIGLATAIEFQRQGAQVVITGRDQKTLQEAKAALNSKALVIRSDVSQLSDLDALYSRIQSEIGHLDVLFANAGIALFAPVTTVTEEFYDKMMNVNVKGLYFTVQKALGLLKPGASVILNSSSLHSRTTPGGSVYSAGKAAVRSLGRSFAAELAPLGIRVNVLSPGPVDTAIFNRLGLSPNHLKAMSDATQKMVPLKRYGRPEELANAALFLASEDSSFMTGADLEVDGGISQI